MLMFKKNHSINHNIHLSPIQARGSLLWQALIIVESVLIYNTFNNQPFEDIIRSDIRSSLFSHIHMLSLPGKIGFRFPVWQHQTRCYGLNVILKVITTERLVYRMSTGISPTISEAKVLVRKCLFAVFLRRAGYAIFAEAIVLSRLSVSEMSQILLSIFQGARVIEYSSWSQDFVQTQDIAVDVSQFHRGCMFFYIHIKLDGL